MDVHPLKALLQLQLGSDSYAVLHLPYILSALTAQSLLPSEHSTKWTARVNSLLQSKSPDARWAGLCLAHKTSVLSKSTMIECAQSWIGVALPVLSVREFIAMSAPTSSFPTKKKEPLPIMSASVRLLRVIFSAATDVPEFQRQVSTPNVSKFTAALIPLAEKHADTELQTLVLSTLALIIPLYPTLHRSLHSALSALSLGFLNGNPFKPPNLLLTRTASRLYAVLHFTGGKVERVPQPPPATEEPLISIPLNVDRLRCSVLVLCDLLKTTTHRPVQVPLGPLTKFALVLLSCKSDQKVDRHIDPTVRAMETAVTPQIWKMACDLITCLATCVAHHLSSSLARIVTCIAFQLEQRLTSSERSSFLDTLHVILEKCHPLHSTVIVNRLARAIVPLISVVLAKEPDARESDGDEVFNISRDVVCPTVDEGNALLSAFAVVRLVLQNPNLSPAMQSILCRIVLSVQLVLPQMSSASLSADPKLHPLLLQQVQNLSVELGAGSTCGMSRSLGLIVGASLGDSDLHRDLEVLLHPRLPPLVRSMPYIESLSLFRAEESQEESEMRRSLGLVPSSTPDVMIPEPSASPTAPRITNATPPRTIQSPSVTPAAEMPAAVLPPPLPRSTPEISTRDDRNIETVAVPVAPLPTRTVNPTPTVEIDMPAFVEEEEKNEEMPAIDLGSDSDSDL
ncbi:Pre-rRNA-processing protein rix1 [Mycena sanguinolenta]|uniref:Pre-rRNA-processing protein RIX1 n=1 Tax=Mycena sanguinolenta TaxID=230812 RepID=A0A8H7D1P7_9AGAR|nr:Pre-rRNA-processing protein rix1 [Mycena sanguinolenta]